MGRGEGGGCGTSFLSSQIFAGLEKSMSFAQCYREQKKNEQKAKSETI